MTTRDARNKIVQLLERSKKDFETAQATFCEEAAINPKQAIEARAANLVELQARYSIATELGHLAVNATEDFRFLDGLRRQHTRFLDDMLTHHSWRANSTCPWSNVVKQDEGKAIGGIVKFLAGLLDELDG